jgi:hypothetical protein
MAASGTLLFLATAGAGCQGGGTATAAAGSPTPPSPSASAPTAQKSSFDGSRAYNDLKAQVAFGPRYPGGPGYEKMRDWLVAELTKAAGVPAKRQDFTRTFGGKTLAMSNVYAQINPEAKTQVMLCAHWDTRPTADQEIDPAKQKQPIPGANDGASGVAVLLELARVFKEKAPGVGVQIVLFDGEDYGPGLDRMFLGAKEYAKSPALPKPAYAILIDMIGDKDLNISREQKSEAKASEVNDKVWHAAQALDYGQFKYGVGYDIEDDHVPLQQAGWKAIDLIDFDYAPWHTLDDTADKCSPESLKAVGDVLAKVVYDEK